MVGARASKLDPLLLPSGRTTVFFAVPAGQNGRSALNSWAAQQRHPAKDMKILSCTLPPFTSEYNLKNSP
jgi:hypothetical protein